MFAEGGSEIGRNRGSFGQWQEALKLLNEMAQDGVAANEVCYNSAISACGKAGEWEKAVALLREMRDGGLTPDELNYNSAISACGKAAQWAHAIRLLREMAVQRLCPDVVSYGAAIDACRKAGKYDRGLALLAEMRDVGLVPNEVCYHSAVTACSEAGRWNEALFVLSEMVKQGLKPDAISYNAAVEACAKSAKWDALIILLQETSRDPDVTLVEAVYNNAIMTCSKYGNWELAATVLQEMEYLGDGGGARGATGAHCSHPGLSPTSASYSAVIDACAKALVSTGASATSALPQWELILSKLDRMREKGLLPDSSSYNAAVRACVCGSVKHWAKAVELLQEMGSRGYLSDQSTSQAVVQAYNAASCTDQSDLGGAHSEVSTRERAVALLHSMTVGGSPFNSDSSESLLSLGCFLSFRHFCPPVSHRPCPPCSHCCSQLPSSGEPAFDPDHLQNGRMLSFVEDVSRPSENSRQFTALLVGLELMKREMRLRSYILAVFLALDVRCLV